MNDIKLSKKFKKALKEKGLTFKWFILTYLPDKKYNHINAQVNGFHTMQDYTKNAINKFLEEK